MTKENDGYTLPPAPDDKPLPQAPVTPPPPKAAESSNSNNEQDATAKELAREFRWVEVWQLVVNGVLALIGIIALIIYNGQLKEMRKATKATQVAAEAAKKSADTAADTLTSTQQQFRMDERPYLWPSPHGGTNLSNPGKPDQSVVIYVNGADITLAAAVDIKNAGRSPALLVQITRTEYIVGPSKKALAAARSYVPEYRNIRGSIVGTDLAQTPVSTVRKLTKEELSQIVNGTWDAYVVGAVRYRDVFTPTTVPYETTYCFHVQPSGYAFAECDFGEGYFGNSIK